MIEDMIWEQVSQILFVPKETYMEALATYSIERVERDGVLLGAVLRREDELHFVTFKNGPIPRQVVRDALAPQFAQYGRVVTRTPKVDPRQHRFNRLVGFRQVGEDEYDIHFELRREDFRL